MKKIINTALLVAFVGVFFSCDNEGELPYKYVDLKGNVILKDKKITRFDQNEDLKISIITAEGVTVESIEVRKDSIKTKVANAVIDDSSASFNASALAPYDKFGKDKDELYGSFDVSLLSKLSNGKTIDNKYPISVVKAVSFSSEVESIEYKRPYDEKTKKGKDSIQKNIIYKVSPLYAKIDKVTLAWKKNEKGTYADTGKTLDIKKDTIDLRTLDYITKYNLKVGDTLYYRLTAEKGSITESLETQVAIVTQATDVSGANQFFADKSYFNLTTKSTKKEGAELEYGVNKISSTSSAGIQFVASSLTGKSLDTYYSKGDLFKIKDDFNAGTSTTSISGLVKGKVYLYKVIRDSKTYYGMIKIGDILNTGTDSEKISIVYKEGTLKL